MLVVPAEAAAPPEVVKLRRQVSLLKRANASLARQVRALRRERANLGAQVGTLTTERDQALTDLNATRGQLVTAQSGTAGAVSTMTPDRIWNEIFPAVRGRYSTSRWSTSYYSSGEYRSYSFTYCGFC